MSERGEGNSTAIVAIVVLVLVALGVFVYWDERGARTPDVNVQVERKAEAPPAPQ